MYKGDRPRQLEAALQAFHGAQAEAAQAWAGHAEPLTPLELQTRATGLGIEAAVLCLEQLLSERPALPPAPHLDDMPVYTISQAAKMLGVSKATVMRWEQAGAIQATRTQGGHRRYSLNQVRDCGQQQVPVGELAESGQ